MPRFSSSLAAVAACTTVAAGLNIPALISSLGPAPAGDPRFTNFVPPGPNDVRSPCPGLNTLANHGFINHDGRNNTIPSLLVGLAQGMNIGADFTTAIGGVGLLSSPNPFGGSFDLNDLDQHNFPIEHDASLSRQDAFFGNDYSFYNPNWQMVVSHFAGMNDTTLLAASEAKFSRVNNSEAINPTFTYGAREFILSYGETALYLQTMGSSDTNGIAPVAFIESLFTQEKLPYALGWRPRAEPITLDSLGNMIFSLFSVNPEAVPEGLTVTTMSYKDIFEITAGGSEVLNNLTSGISSFLGL